MTDTFHPDADGLYLVPLGGCGHFGANLTLYGHDGKWLMVDCGMGFADDTMPGVDVLLPDPTFLEQCKGELAGLVVTHGHEDHIGAIAHIWPRFECPIYATKFTCELLRMKLAEKGWGSKVKLVEIDRGGEVTLDPFHVRFVSMAHSIPEANALAITVDAVGTVLHTGDWKIDPEPVASETTDEAALRALGEDGVLAIVGDSTNAMVPGHSGSESMVSRNLTEIFGEFKQRIVISCFSSNVGRIESIARAAEANGRSVALVGRSLWRADEAARNTGYMSDIKPFIEDFDAMKLPRDKVVLLCTGSQGEPRAALMRIANENHRAVKLDADDVVLLSARAIPGNDLAIDRMKNRLLRMGVNIVTDREAPIHVSGHPYREELKQIFDWVKPEIVVPVHGEHMQQEKHADLARECGIEKTIMPVNGSVVRLAPGEEPAFVGEVRHGLLAVEGKRIVPIDHESIMVRRRIMYNGSAVVTVVVNGKGELVTEPQVTAMGLVDEECELDVEYLDGAIEAVTHSIKSLAPHLRGNDEEVSEAARIAARRFFNDTFGRKPQTRVHLVRI